VETGDVSGLLRSVAAAVLLRERTGARALIALVGSTL
jgi:hypothetical protein